MNENVFFKRIYVTVFRIVCVNNCTLTPFIQDTCQLCTISILTEHRGSGSLGVLWSPNTLTALKSSLLIS